MKSLIKKKAVRKTAKAPSDKPAETKVAQCCAKVSKAVAGCHD